MEYFIILAVWKINLEDLERLLNFSRSCTFLIKFQLKKEEAYFFSIMENNMNMQNMLKEKSQHA